MEYCIVKMFTLVSSSSDLSFLLAACFCLQYIYAAPPISIAPPNDASTEARMTVVLPELELLPELSN